MKRTLLAGTIFACACALLAQPQATPQQQQPPSQPGYPPNTAPGMGRSPDPMAGDGALSRIDDKAFLKRVAADDMMQVELGKLAAEKASSDAVKQYGRKMADDRQKTHEEVTQLAAKQGVPVPETLDSKHKSKIDKLAKLEGQNFDKAFLKEATHNDGDDIAEFQAEANGGSDAAVKSFATRVLPMLQAHVQMAKSLQSANGTQDQHR